MNFLLALTTLLFILGSASGNQCSSRGNILPDGIAWLQAHLTRSPIQGTAVRPLGITLRLGIAGETNREEQNAHFLDQFFGANASQEFHKDAISLKEDETPEYLKEILLSEIPIPIDSSDILVAFWHCTDDLGSCSKWQVLLKELLAEKSLQIRGSESYFEVFRGPDGDTICLRDLEVSPNNGKIYMENLNRALEGSGSHRELHSSITMKIHEQWTNQQCDVVLLEHLPSSIFADSFELQRMTMKGALKYVHLYGDLDLERPAYFSRQSIIELHKPFIVGEGGSARAEFVLPLHVRYAPLSFESHYLANLSLPQLFLSCKNASYAVKHGGSSPGVIEWAIPAGNLGHAAFVPQCTFLVAVLTTVILAFASLFSAFRKKTKAF